MRIVVRRAQEQKWRKDHAECIDAYHAMGRSKGVTLTLAYKSTRWCIPMSIN